MKYDIPNDKPELFDNYFNEITEVLNNLSEDDWRTEE